jgi:hypothetical protein
MTTQDPREAIEVIFELILSDVCERRKFLIEAKHPEFELLWQIMVTSKWGARNDGKL